MPKQCGYFKMVKGRPTCTHPTDGEMITKYQSHNLAYRCNLCKQAHKGIYPSELPKANQDNWKYDVVDKKGSIIIENFKGE